MGYFLNFGDMFSLKCAQCAKASNGNLANRFKTKAFSQLLHFFEVLRSLLGYLDLRDLIE